jgi:hypothetical protein
MEEQLTLYGELLVGQYVATHVHALFSHVKLSTVSACALEIL